MPTLSGHTYTRREALAIIRDDVVRQEAKEGESLTDCGRVADQCVLFYQRLSNAALAGALEDIFGKLPQVVD